MLWESNLVFIDIKPSEDSFSRDETCNGCYCNFLFVFEKWNITDQGCRLEGEGGSFPRQKTEKVSGFLPKFLIPSANFFYSCVVNSDKKLTFKRSSSFFLTTSEIKTLSAKKIWQKTYRFRIFCLVSAKKWYEDTFCQNSYTKQI